MGRGLLAVVQRHGAENVQFLKKRNIPPGNSSGPLAVQWLELSAFTAEGAGSIPGRGTKILQAEQCDQKEKRKKMKRPSLLS